MTPEIRTATRWFQEHAGWCTPPGRMICAQGLAYTEAAVDKLESLGVLKVSWTYDDDPDLSWMTERERANVQDVLILEIEALGEVSALCGIVDPDDDYRRVLVAEVASEIPQVAQLAECMRAGKPWIIEIK